MLNPMTNKNLLHQDLIKLNSVAFCQKVIDYSHLLNINPDWLMQVMYKETGGTFNPAIKNKAGSGAVGLIQFMPDTAKMLDTTILQLSKMSNVQQLYFVYKYLYPFRNRMKTFGDTYLAVFYPAAIGKPDDFLLPAYITRQNKGLDANKSGQISRGEIIKWASKD